MRAGFRRMLLLAAAAATGASCAQIPSARGTAGDHDRIRQVEQLRLKLLVAGDVAAARELHADDFQLVNPAGKTLTRDEYLGSLSSGYLDYLRWDPGPIEVRITGDLAVIRYPSQLQVSLGGKPRPLRPHWHTDTYEKRNGRWLVVWSQATEVQ